MAGVHEDHRTHLHQVASSNLPTISRKSWEYYVAILQPGIPLKKCEHGDFLWMKVNRMVTIDKILKLHFERTGRNSILMDGGGGLTTDTRVRDIPYLGLGVYALWEIVKVERWWEYKVRPTDINESSGVMEESKHAGSRGRRFGPVLAIENLSLMGKEGYRERMQNTSVKGAAIVNKEEQRWSWEAMVPLTNLHGASIGSRSRGGRFKDSMASVSKLMTEKEKAMEPSTSTKIPPIEINEEIRGSERSKLSNNLKSQSTKEERGQTIRRCRTDLENGSDASAKRRRTKLDSELELVG
ncbi:6ad3d9e0-b5ff-42fa-b73b-303fb28c0da8 [Sclerotinia trifoliorum]|uniref:6ad3d9e0-b5ff-42fa-b73b-303fb28c0da8 n=1 Tax=Sclerotinia trifoliorum TaxID=28548 RepID=A0A8H2W0J0_9HELO|nr:6ad3d9e0-b5ff-42fa-b73b-303fb28c0da8 [Sclerotinia trifoliorum]